MGEDKLFLRFGKTTLLDHVLVTAKEVCETVTLVGNKEKLRPYGWVVEDVFPGQGPLAGIHAGLMSPAAAEWNLFLAVDTPAIDAKFLDFLITSAKESAKMVTVPRVDGRLHPLCAVYRPEFAPLAERALKARENKIAALFAPEKTRIIEEAEIRAAGFEFAMFDNVNTPEDWLKMQRQLGASSWQ